MPHSCITLLEILLFTLHDCIIWQILGVQKVVGGQGARQGGFACLRAITVKTRRCGRDLWGKGLDSRRYSNM